MGVRFDKWLARPSTLHFLRQLIGPEYAATTTRPRRRPAALPRNLGRSYTSVPASIPNPSQHGTVKRNLNAQSAAAKETYHEQRRRVAKELGLRIPEDEDDGRTTKDGSLPAWTSYSDLMYAEARVRDNSSTRGLLIDHPENLGNIEAWCHILQYRERTDGFNGVLDVWKGMRKRGIQVPIDGEFADMFWTTFLHNAVIKNADESHKSLLREVYAYAKDRKTAGMGHYQSFYKTLIGRILRVVPGEARQLGPEREWHTRTQVDGFRPEKALSEVMLDVLKSSRPDVASRRFRRMYHDDADRSLYDFCMPVVLSHASDDLSTIMQWHNFFVLNNDMPSSELADTAPIKNLIRLAGAHDGKLVLSRDERRDLIAFFNENRAAQRNLDILGLSRASMNSLVGDVHGIKPKAVSDEFCARMFATRAFALETIIRGIALLGIEAVGPVALRELAIRAVSPSVFKARLTDIKDSGVQLVPSIYTRLLEKTATGSNADLFQALLNSDQHPENYDDKHMQETLLSNFLESEDFSQIHLTVLALSLADHEMAARAWNRVLQHHIKAGNYVEFLRIYNELGVHQLRLTTRSLNFMMDHFLHERSPSKRPNIWSKPDAARLVPLEFVINAHLYAAEHGSDIPLDRWVELLKRCGMTGKMEDLASLSSWLAARYSQPAQGVLSDDVYSGSTPYLRKTYAINYIFDRPMVRALVIWGFRKAAEYDELRTPPDQQVDKLGLNPGLAHPEASNDRTRSWTQGIALLLQLKRLGVRVRAKDVRRAVEEALWPLFGPAFSDRKINSRSIRRNHLGLNQYVKDVNEVWDRPVFDISEQLLMDDHPHAKAKLLPKVFGYERLVDQKEGTWVDVEAWALADGTWHEPFATHRERQENWEEFPFKFSDNLTSKERYRSGRHRPLRKRPERPFTRIQHPAPATETSNDATTSEESLTLPQHPPPAAQTSNSHPPPNPPNTPEES